MGIARQQSCTVHKDKLRHRGALSDTARRSKDYHKSVRHSDLLMHAVSIPYILLQSCLSLKLEKWISIMHLSTSLTALEIDRKQHSHTGLIALWQLASLFVTEDCQSLEAGVSYFHQIWSAFWGLTSQIWVHISGDHVLELIKRCVKHHAWQSVLLFIVGAEWVFENEQ